MNYKKLRDWHSGFHDWVIRRHPTNTSQQNGFMGGFIFGERGEGKSTYCYKVDAKIYYTLNGYNTTDDEEDAYKEALNFMFFDPSEFRKFLIYNKIKRIVTPSVCLDDASMHFGNMLHITNPRIYAALLGETATIRTTATGFLINAPKRKHVAKFLRDYDDFKGEVKIREGGTTAFKQTWNRKVRYYRWNYYPDEVKYRIQVPFQDKYSCYIPTEYYIWYLDKKRYYELKHELEVADRVDKTARIVFIENKNELPAEFKKVVERWELESEEMIREEERKEQLKKVQEMEFRLRAEKLKGKIEKLKEIKD